MIVYDLVYNIIVYNLVFIIVYNLSYNLWFCVCLFVGHGPYLVMEEGAFGRLETW